MNWTYALERMPSDDHENRHVVRVTSKPRKNSDGSGSSAAMNAGGKIDIRFFTNVDEHAIKVRRERETEQFFNWMDEYNMGRPLSRNVLFSFLKSQLPIELHSSCSFSPTARWNMSKMLYKITTE